MLTILNETVTPLTIGTALATVAIVLMLKLVRGPQRRLAPLFSLPLLGDGLALATQDPVRFLFGRFKRYGKVFKLRFPGFSAYLITDMDAARPAYMDQTGKPEVPYQAFSLIMGPYNLPAKPQAHGPCRKMLLSALGPAGMSDMFPRVLATMQPYLERWEQQGSMELFKESTRMGMDLAVDAVCNIQLSDKVDRGWFKEQMRTFLNGMWGLPYRLPGSALDRAVGAKEALLTALAPEMEHVHARFLHMCGGQLPRVAARMQEGGQLLNVHEPLIAGFFQVGYRGIRDAAMGVLHAVMGASDTTRFALLNPWALVALSPRVQDELFAEQQRVIAEYGPEVSYSAVSNMPYMKATVKEAMRLLPVSSGAPRRLTEDTVVDGVRIPKGSYVLLHAHLMHALDPVLWDGDMTKQVPPHMDWRDNFDEAFKPERWLREETRPKHYVTFGSYAHSCPAINLVYMELKVMLSLVVRRYVLRLRTPDMLARAERYFPFLVPRGGTDTVELQPRGAQAGGEGGAGAGRGDKRAGEGAPLSSAAA